jgi:hypothetical protein
MSDLSNEEKFDGMLFTLAQQHTGGIKSVKFTFKNKNIYFQVSNLSFQKVLETIFSFLARKTDFFVGGAPGVAKGVIDDCFNKYDKLARQRNDVEKAVKDEADRVKREKLRKKREEEEKLGAAQIVEVTDEEASKIQADIEASKVC